ncbi:hypothetical protein [Acinetobacter chinensis]|uniref:hypothetical protein n=1 Tax=Acinetobacter chinensis TaxID=2004650 RepID=UPI002934DB90|nr:hypothetical protein [Acinetobacter chinensis]WOE41987.1 hypothetical protein QSG87_02235 [Acinetobacter chinensis]
MEKPIKIELNLKQIDQLHNATLQFSNFCFEIKKTCIATIFIVLTFVVTFTNKELDLSIFIISYITVICFWLLDSTAYFYQVKLRTMMNRKFSTVLTLSGQTPENDAAIEDSRSNESIPKKLFSSSFNASMILYYILLALNTLGLILFLCNAIK